MVKALRQRVAPAERKPMGAAVVGGDPPSRRSPWAHAGDWGGAVRNFLQRFCLRLWPLTASHDPHGSRRRESRNHVLFRPRGAAARLLRRGCTRPESPRRDGSRRVVGWALGRVSSHVTDRGLDGMPVRLRDPIAREFLTACTIGGYPISAGRADLLQKLIGVPQCELLGSSTAPQAREGFWIHPSPWRRRGSHAANGRGGI